MNRVAAHRGALEAIERILNRGGDADEVLRAVVDVLHDRLDVSWVGLAFVEGDRLVLGPRRGSEAEWPSELAVPVAYQGKVVAQLQLDAAEEAAFGDDDRVFLERVAVLISAHCLVGWDTAGVPWPEV